MTNLFQLALEATKKNATTRKAKNINQRLLEVLKDNVKFNREELKVKITLLRIKEEVQYKDELLKEAQIYKLIENKDKPFLEFFNKTAKTVKNGLDTSISNSKNNSSFSHNPLYKHLALKCDSNNKFYITKA